MGWPKTKPTITQNLVGYPKHCLTVQVRDPILWVPNDSDYERLSRSRWPPGYFWWFSGFIFMQKNDHKIKWYSKVYFRETKYPEIKTISSRTHLSGHFRLAGSLPEWFWAHACAKNRGIHCLSHLPASSRTPVEHARAHSLAPSLSTHVTCSPCI
jgi:hypothetical protein